MFGGGYPLRIALLVVCWLCGGSVVLSQDDLWLTATRTITPQYATYVIDFPLRHIFDQEGNSIQQAVTFPKEYAKFLFTFHLHDSVWFSHNPSNCAVYHPLCNVSAPTVPPHVVCIDVEDTTTVQFVEFKYINRMALIEGNCEVFFSASGIALYGGMPCAGVSAGSDLLAEVDGILSPWVRACTRTNSARYLILRRGLFGIFSAALPVFDSTLFSDEIVWVDTLLGANGNAIMQIVSMSVCGHSVDMTLDFNGELLSAGGSAAVDTEEPCMLVPTEVLHGIIAWTNLTCIDGTTTTSSSSSPSDVCAFIVPPQLPPLVIELPNSQFISIDMRTMFFSDGQLCIKAHGSIRSWAVDAIPQIPMFVLGAKILDSVAVIMDKIGRRTGFVQRRPTPNPDPFCPVEVQCTGTTAFFEQINVCHDVLCRDLMFKQYNWDQRRCSFKVSAVVPITVLFVVLCAAEAAVVLWHVYLQGKLRGAKSQPEGALGATGPLSGSRESVHREST